MLYGITYVRLADEHGNEYSAPTSKAVPKGHKVLKDKVAIDGNGDPLPVKPHVDLATAVRDGLKGQALQAALVNAGLSTDGTADEKRARVAEYYAEHPELETSDTADQTGGDQS